MHPHADVKCSNSILREEARAAFYRPAMVNVRASSTNSAAKSLREMCVEGWRGFSAVAVTQAADQLWLRMVNVVSWGYVGACNVMCPQCMTTCLCTSEPTSTIQEPFSFFGEQAILW